jgi:hypothetical protein
MMMMAGQSNPAWHYAAGKWPGKVGLLLGPSYFKKQALRPWLPYALDNDAYISWQNQKEWSESAWREMLQWARMTRYKPLWAIVPDVVANRKETLENWKRYAFILDEIGWPKAFAVQDGMTPDDVPESAALVFVGGSTSFKWRTVTTWVKNFRRVHVGRVNNIEKVWMCQDIGVESVDGTGWFKDPSCEKKLPALFDWFANQRSETTELALTYDVRPNIC